MTISSIGGSPSQLFAAQQALAASALSLDPTADDSADDLTTEAASSTPANNLTGSTTASLDSQTLQALMGLTQQDPTTATPQTGQAQHAHHHHHGGGQKTASTTDSSTTTASTTTTGTSSDASSPISDTDDSTDASLESALLSL